jgi:PTS system nitrogen regulatory IIA component
MELSVRESASLLNVSEKTVYRWIKQGLLPAYLLNDQYRLNRAELLEWATARRMNVSVDIFAEPHPARAVVTLSEAVRAGGVHYDVPGGDKASVLRAVVQRMPLPPGTDSDFVLQVLLARESLGSTALGNGVAVPHVRNPVVVQVPHPMLTLCFLRQPVEYGSLDGQPVHTLFTMLSPTVRVHLQMLARLAFALRQPAFADAVAQRAPHDEILAACTSVDHSIPTAAAGKDDPNESR